MRMAMRVMIAVVMAIACGGAMAADTRHWVEHDKKAYASLREYGLAHRNECEQVDRAGQMNCCAGFQDFLWGHWHGFEGSHVGLSALASQADQDVDNETHPNAAERNLLFRICEKGK
jgi:hypothetical protein